MQTGETGAAVATSPRTVRLLLVEGRAGGLTVASIGSWNGSVLAAPRSAMSQLLQRPECAGTGIYIFIGPDEDRVGGHKAYIGEADNVTKRLRHHLRTGDHDFFEQVAVAVTSDASLTKAHGRYLEAQLIGQTRQAGGVRLGNDRFPDFRGLPEADLVDMDHFLGQLCLVLPLLGFDLYRSPPGASPARPQSAAGVMFAFATAGASATARNTEDGFVVLAGSTARRAGTGTFPAGYRAQRDQLVADGRMVDAPEPELLRFAVDVLFASPSAAASVVAARSASGPLEWKVVGTGQSYRDWSAAKLD